MEWNFIGFFAVMMLIIGTFIAIGMRLTYRQQQKHTIMVLRQSRRDEERKHAERLRAMELGLVQRRAALTWPGSAVCLGIGAGVPVGSMLAAWLAVVGGGKADDAFGPAMWVGVLGIGAGVYLARRMMDPAEGDWVAVDSGRPGPERASKSVVAPDAYDVVGSRG